MAKKMARASFVVLAMTLAICIVQCLPVQSIFDPRLFLKPHNMARASVGVAPLDWNPDLAKLAAGIVHRLINETNCFRSKNENLSGWINDIMAEYGINPHFTKSSMKMKPSADEIVDEWVEMKKYYNYDNNSCSLPTYCCWPYKQVAWRKSLWLGCDVGGCAMDWIYWDSPYVYGFYSFCLCSPGAGGEPKGRPY